MKRYLSAAADLWRRILELAPKPFGGERGPVADVAALEVFVARQAAFIAQTALFGYLRTRMGTRYGEIFQDETFSGVIQQASAQIFVACASDLTTFAAANIGHAQPNFRPSVDALSAQVFDAALRQGLADLDIDIAQDDARAAFAARRRETDWSAMAARGEAPFATSPDALVRYAPVVDDLKALDSEIIMNSMRFRWQEVRRRYRARIDAAAIAADWASRRA